MNLRIAIAPFALPLIAAAALLPAPSAAQGGAACDPEWLHTFGGEPGTDGTVYALAVFDDGSGPALYAGGTFQSAGGQPASNIARWDGASWSAVGEGTNGLVHALAVFDDGGGPALYAGGEFTGAGGAHASRIAKWDGASWSALGSGVDADFTTFVYALAVFDDGTGPALHAGGRFTSAGGVPASYIAKWDGASWSAVGTGTSGPVFALTALDDGSGPALYAGGFFSSAGGAQVNHVAKWDGASWSALGSGVNGDVWALTSFDDGGGPALFAGGKFFTAGGVSAMHVAKWDGASWSSLAQGVSYWEGLGESGDVPSLLVFDDGGGPALYAGGIFKDAGSVAAFCLAKWDGSAWSALGSELNGGVRALATFDDGGGAKLCAGGSFTTAGGLGAHSIAGWNGSTWSSFGTGPSGAVKAVGTFDDGTGPALYAGGAFTSMGSAPVSYLAKWDGASWSELGSGIGGYFVDALASYDDGGGPALYAGGGLSSAGGVATNGIARWNGTSWSALGGGVIFSTGAPGVVEALAAFDDGGGPALYVGGAFHAAGGQPAWFIAKWNGSTWSPLGSGVEPFGILPVEVWALAVFDDGTGPALYVGGLFKTAGGVAANSIARWDGAAWSPLGSGVTGGGPFTEVRALAVFDDGSGPALVAGGLFAQAGGVAVNNIARWDGSSWSTLGGGLSGGLPPRVRDLAVHTEGGGTFLYAAGEFTSAGGVSVNNIARWDGLSWSAPGGAAAAGPAFSFAVHALASFDDGVGPALYAGGDFSQSPAGDSFLSKWACAAIAPIPGCAANPARLAALATGAPLGVPLDLQVTGFAAVSGLAVVFYGQPGFDAAGCGFLLPGYGELLLALAPPPLLAASAALAGGASSLSVFVPATPTLLGLTAHLQGAGVDPGLPAVELSNALSVKLGP